MSRLTEYYAKHDEPNPAEGPFQVSFKELLPFADYFSVMDRHWEVR